jgi:hypothetical protein
MDIEEYNLKNGIVSLERDVLFQIYVEIDNIKIIQTVFLIYI